jgi:hypothetical protein
MVMLLGIQPCRFCFRQYILLKASKVRHELTSISMFIIIIIKVRRAQGLVPSETGTTGASHTRLLMDEYLKALSNRPPPMQAS